MSQAGNFVKHIALIGYYGFDNIGDEALLEVIINNWQVSAKETNLWVFYNPENISRRRQNESESSPGLNFVSRDNLLDVFHVFLKTKLFILGGGSLLQNSTSNRSLYYYLGMILLAKCLGNKVVLLAQGIGPIRGKFPQLLTRLVLKLVDKITCRDQDSIDLLKSYGINKADLTADLAYLLKASASAIAQAGVSKSNSIGLIIREVPGFTDEQIVSQVLSSVQKHGLWDSPPNLILIPFQPEDKPYCSRIMEKIEASCNGCFGSVSLSETGLKPSLVLDCLAQFKLIISMRLHGLIFAKIAEIPYEGIIYDPKVKAFLEDKRSLKELRTSAQNLLHRIRQNPTGF